jgi:hypothetical protein
MNHRDNMIFTALGITAAIFVVGFILNFLANWMGMQPVPKEERFTVVDQYKGCDVVRYSDQQMATYKYFLHCEK